MLIKLIVNGLHKLSTCNSVGCGKDEPGWHEQAALLLQWRIPAIVAFTSVSSMVHVNIYKLLAWIIIRNFLLTLLC